MTIREAAQEWVKGFNAIPREVIEKLDDFTEVTPFAIGDTVNVFGNGQSEDGNGEGEIADYIYDENGERDAEMFIVKVAGELYELSDGTFERMYDSTLPMWGTMWAFGESIDTDWIYHGGLEAMAKCGFRIYEQEDFVCVFGIDGAGYDFYDEHWIPLYKERGLQWHDTQQPA